MGLFHVALLLCFIILNISSFKIGFKSQKYRINYSYTSLQSSVAGRDPRGAGGGRQAVPPPPINQYIKADKVRLLVSGNESGDGDVMIGVMPLAEAQEYADKLQVDLVLINDKGDPPVCKAIDYGKYKYSLEKKKKERAKKQVQSEIKEIKMSYKIEEHDYNVRLKAIQKFLSEGDKVSFSYIILIIYSLIYYH